MPLGWRDERNKHKPIKRKTSGCTPDRVRALSQRLWPKEYGRSVIEMGLNLVLFFCQISLCTSRPPSRPLRPHSVPTLRSQDKLCLPHHILEEKGLVKVSVTVHALVEVPSSRIAPLTWAPTRPPTRRADAPPWFEPPPTHTHTLRHKHRFFHTSQRFCVVAVLFYDHLKGLQTVWAGTACVRVVVGSRQRVSGHFNLVKTGKIQFVL